MKQCGVSVKDLMPVFEYMTSTSVKVQCYKLNNIIHILHPVCALNH